MNEHQPIIELINNAAGVDSVEFGVATEQEVWITTTYPVTINGIACNVAISHLPGGSISHDWGMEILEHGTGRHLGRYVSGGSVSDLVHNFPWEQIA